MFVTRHTVSSFHWIEQYNQNLKGLRGIIFLRFGRSLRPIRSCIFLFYFCNAGECEYSLNWRRSTTFGATDATRSTSVSSLPSIRRCYCWTKTGTEPFTRMRNNGDSHNSFCAFSSEVRGTWKTNEQVVRGWATWSWLWTEIRLSLVQTFSKTNFKPNIVMCRWAFILNRSLHKEKESLLNWKLLCVYTWAWESGRRVDELRIWNVFWFFVKPDLWITTNQ